MSKKIFFILCVLLCATTRISFGASDSFNTRLLIGGDTTPPSTPTLLTGIPVAQTQIDIAWGASTDDFLLGGYQVFRGPVQIATTTLTSYSDTGLTASTNYSYFIRAFDSAFNLSSSSNVFSTTTLSSTPTSTPLSTDQGTSGSKTSLRLLNISVVTAQHSATVSWEASRYAQFELRWGRTASYELGFVSNELFKKEHSTTITELFPATTYTYQLIGYDHEGRTVVLKEGQFTTKTAPDTVALINVSNLRAVAMKQGVQLSWTNPSDADFSHVRIVRSHLFYPSGTFDGTTLYQDEGTLFFDSMAFASHDVQHYTVFSYDKNGNVSSGALVAVSKNGKILLLPNTEIIKTTASSTEVQNLLRLRFSDIEFIQQGAQVGTSRISASLPLLIRIAYEKLPEHLKTVTVSIAHPSDTDASFSFLLRINNDKSYYEATVAPLVLIGVYPTSLFVFDYQTRALSSVTGRITTYSTGTQSSVRVPESFLSRYTLTSHILIRTFVYFWWLLLLLFLYKTVRVVLNRRP